MNMRSMRSQRGFTLLEAMMAMLITAFGMLTLVGMQMMLSRNADVAKQRTEATRIDQERIEGMRSFTQIATQPGTTVLAWDDLASRSDALAASADRNAAYSIDSTLGGAVADPLRQVSVVVSWTDRANLGQNVTLRSVIARSDPADVGALGFPLPGNTTLKRPKNRSLNIPVPAITLGDTGKSAFNFANFSVIFSNDLGYVVQKCDHAVTSADNLSTGCTAYNAFIYSGYVSKTVAAFPLLLGISLESITGTDSSRQIRCDFADARDQNTGAVISGFKYYLCVVPMVTGQKWSGKVKLTGMTAGTNLQVCRMQYAPSAGGTNNARNWQPYVDVNDSLENQNYVIAPAPSTNTACPTVSSLVTTPHQMCSTNLDRVTQCPLPVLPPL